MRRLEGKVAVVTGGARGIGRAVADAMAKQGALVVIGDTAQEEAARTAHDISVAGGAAVAVEVDVASRPAVEALADAAVRAFGVPSIAFCSAGIVTAGGETGALEIADEEWQRVLAVNLFGTFVTCQVLARTMVTASAGGSLITVSSIGADRPMAGAPAYHASKAGIAGLTRALAVNLAQYRIRANTIAPGYIATEMTKFILDDENRKTVLIGRIPIGRIGKPGDLAGTAIYLASDDSEYVTGQTIHVDGGAFVQGWTPAEPVRDQ
jgi:3-oxoacyl-[acyl-carrier protein] reductase